MQIGRVQITYNHTPPDLLHGRFGGGWQWKVGIQASRNFRSVLVSLLVASILIRIHKKETPHG